MTQAHRNALGIRTGRAAKLARAASTGVVVVDLHVLRQEERAAREVVLVAHRVHVALGLGRGVGRVLAVAALRVLELVDELVAAHRVHDVGQVRLALVEARA